MLENILLTHIWFFTDYRYEYNLLFSSIEYNSVTLLAKYNLSLPINILSNDLFINRLILLDFNRLVKYIIPKLIHDDATKIRDNFFISSFPCFWIIIFDAINIVVSGIIPKLISKSIIGMIFKVIIFDIINATIV